MNAKPQAIPPPMCFECGAIFDVGYQDYQWPYNGDKNRCLKCKPRIETDLEPGENECPDCYGKGCKNCEPEKF